MITTSFLQKHDWNTNDIVYKSGHWKSLYGTFTQWDSGCAVLLMTEESRALI